MTSLISVQWYISFWNITHQSWILKCAEILCVITWRVGGSNNITNRFPQVGHRPYLWNEVVSHLKPYRTLDRAVFWMMKEILRRKRYPKEEGEDRNVDHYFEKKYYVHHFLCLEKICFCHRTISCLKTNLLYCLISPFTSTVS